MRLLSMPGAEHSVERAFNKPDTVLMASARPLPLPLRHWHLQRALNVSSLPQLRRVLRHRVPPDLQFIVYDAEHWRFTPQQEQRHPGRSTRIAAQLAHAHGLRLIAAPATDLVRAQERGTRRHGSMYQAFVATGMARRIARWADWYEIQAQGSEDRPPLYAEFVASVQRQVRGANPTAFVLAGLSTNPGGRDVTARILYEDIQNTRARVSGYWLNVPQGGSRCPSCGEARPEVALRLLRLLQR